MENDRFTDARELDKGLKKVPRITFLGGDTRQIFAAERLASRYEVGLWGLEKGSRDLHARLFSEWEGAIDGADAVLLPLPASSDGVRIFMPMGGDAEPLRLDVLLPRLEGKLLLGGRMSDAIRARADEAGLRWVDYYESELLQLRNAVPTAEGAIAIGMQELPVTLDGSEVGVIGYGRIGSVLADKLTALGARVTVYARRAEQRALAEMHRQRALPIYDRSGECTVARGLQDCRAIWNTVPSRILTRSVLEEMPRDCLLIELASPPGGIDLAAATELGIRTVWGAALPGRCAPESAGRILGEVLDEILSRHFGI